MLYRGSTHYLDLVLDHSMRAGLVGTLEPPPHRWEKSAWEVSADPTTTKPFPHTGAAFWTQRVLAVGRTPGAFRGLRCFYLRYCHVLKWFYFSQGWYYLKCKLWCLLLCKASPVCASSPFSQSFSYREVRVKQPHNQDYASKILLKIL